LGLLVFDIFRAEVYGIGDTQVFSAKQGSVRTHTIN